MADTTKNILMASVFKEGLPVKAPTANRKMDIILRGGNLDDF